MSNVENSHPDDAARGVSPRPSSLERIFNAISATACAIGTLWIIAVMLLINSDVLGRAVFDSPVRGVPELVSISIVAIVFLQITHTLRKQRFIRSDVIIDRLMAKMPRVGYVIQAVQNLIGAGLLGTIFYFTINRFYKAWDIDDYIGTEGDFTAPLWPILLIILIGCFGTSLQYFMHAFENLRSALNQEDDEGVADE
jgi:TRAP-type C4-dicarboxylate transport system permease small subunit